MLPEWAVDRHVREGEAIGRGELLDEVREEGVVKGGGCGHPGDASDEADAAEAKLPEDLILKMVDQRHAFDRERDPPDQPPRLILDRGQCETSTRQARPK